VESLQFGTARVVGSTEATAKSLRRSMLAYTLVTLDSGTDTFEELWQRRVARCQSRASRNLANWAPLIEGRDFDLRQGTAGDRALGRQRRGSRDMRSSR
jgi:hypothetical protein